MLAFFAAVDRSDGSVQTSWAQYNYVDNKNAVNAVMEQAHADASVDLYIHFPRETGFMGQSYLLLMPSDARIIECADSIRNGV